MKTQKWRVSRAFLTVGLMVSLTFLLVAQKGVAAPGDLLQTVGLPGNGGCSVSGTFAVTDFGAHYFTINSDGCYGTVIGVFAAPPLGGDPNTADPATVVATKNIVDASNNPVNISGLAWDAARTTAGNVVLWGAHDQDVYLIDVGDPTTSDDAVATFMFSTGLAGFDLVDGLARDPADDTLYLSPDVDHSVYQFSLGTDVNPGNPAMGTLMNTVSPQDENGVEDGTVSGVAIGTENSLYIGRNGNAEIRRVDKTTGAFISEFATTNGRVENLTCDPVTYAPLEAILAKNAYDGLYEAFEVDPGTCPLPVPPVTDVTVDIEPETCLNPLWDKKHHWGFFNNVRVAILGSEELDVSTIDPNSIQLEGVSPKSHWKSDDVLSWIRDIFVSVPADPAEKKHHKHHGKHDKHKGYDKKCDRERPDGYADLVLLFKARDLIEAIEAEIGREVEDGEVFTLTLTGQFLPDAGGGDFSGQDDVVIHKPAPPKKYGWHHKW